ncbi:hypothetical protein B0H14DRAFT_2632553 [Mycena olivaceomarginata]|nr:hypothetical protein B0H14DRAFT_2632553 [Mycena olivaceomarginata]
MVDELVEEADELRHRLAVASGKLEDTTPQTYRDKAPARESVATLEEEVAETRRFIGTVGGQLWDGARETVEQWRQRHLRDLRFAYKWPKRNLSTRLTATLSMASNVRALSRRSLRASQPATRSGAGVHFTSPLRERDEQKKRRVIGTGRAATIGGLRARLSQLLADDLPSTPPAQDQLNPAEPPAGPLGEAEEGNDWIDVDPEPPAPALPPVPGPRPGLAAAERLNLAWNVLLPILEGPYAQYLRSSYGQRPSLIPLAIHYECTTSYYQMVDVTTCCCMPVATLLVQNGVFPASPTKVQTGISIDLLGIYRALFERSCDAVTALASALQSIYQRFGFPVHAQRNTELLATDPFRKLLGQAVLWDCNLRVRLQAKVDAALVAAELALAPPAPDPVPAGAAEPPVSATNIARTSDAPSLLMSIDEQDDTIDGRDDTPPPPTLPPRTPYPATPEPPVHETAPASNTTRPSSPMSIDEPDTTSPPPCPSPHRSIPSPSPPPTPLPPPTSPLPTPPSPPRPSPRPSPPRPPTNPPPTPLNPPPLTPGRAARVLRERCPACFGLEEWGRSLRDGGDVQLGADGCFSFRHLRSAGDGPISYDSSYFVSKEKVARVEKRINEARKKKPAVFKPAIPQEALDACQESWNAANEKKQKTDTKHFDAGGVFVMTCRHSQVLFLCDIDTPGEQQKYIVALLEEVNSLLPPQATILQAYDVGCVTDHSFNLFHILTNGFRERVSFIINAMHAFGHRPRCRGGAGLSDMEGVERFWSRIRKLIPLTRTQWYWSNRAQNSRRLWTIDQYTSFVNQEGLDRLGAWLKRQETKNLTKKRKAAVTTLIQCGVPEAELRLQWAAQKKAQTSARSHAPMRLQRNLDKVLKLQEQIDTVEKSISDAKQSLTSGDGKASPDTLAHLRRLQVTHEILSSQAEALYASLNIHASFPELRGLPLDFVRTLVIMRDLKINIRGRAIESFYEWETLDRAVAGRWEPLGTKLHQATQKTISKRAPALLKAINKFNSHCANLERLRPSGCTIPIPLPLPTKLSLLREDPSLHEDVWVTPSEGEIPRWLDNADVRDGIRALHTFDRCQEEARRLHLERNNLMEWLSHELAVAERAIDTNEDLCLELPLEQRRQRLQYLESSWQLPKQTHFAHFLQSAPSASLPTSTSTFSTTAVPSAASIRTSSATSTALTAGITPSMSTGASGLARTSAGSRIGASTRAPARTSSSTLSAASTSAATRAPARASSSTLSAASTILEPVALFEEPASNAVPTVDLEEIDPSDISDVYDIQGGAYQAESDDEEDSSGFNTGLSNLQIIWQCASPRWRLPRVVVGINGRSTVEVLIPDLDRLRSPASRLNGEILNGAAAALLNLFDGPTSLHNSGASRCALLNTYDLHRTRGYWEKPVWIIPVHRPKEEHWVLVVAAVQENRLFFFDSLGLRSGWRQDMQDIMLLIKRMVFIAGRNGHRMYISTEDETWTARPLCDERNPLQSNGYDCGVWVLCMIASVLRGFHTSNISEALMSTVRQVLTDHILTLPFQTARQRS